MIKDKAPSFDELADLLVEEGAVTHSPSELHGSLVGFVASGKRLNHDELNRYLAQQLDLDRITGPSSQKQLRALYAGLVNQLKSHQFELALLLPDEEIDLALRAEQLGLWVTGFLAGFGLGISDQSAQLSEEAQESLKDLVQIAQIESQSGDQEEEGLLIEVEEYVRMAAMLLFTECNSEDSTDTSHQPTLH